MPLNLEIKLEEKDIAFAIHQLVESIPEEAFYFFRKTQGATAYHPRMILKIILCGYTQSVFFGRKIEALMKDSIRMKEDYMRNGQLKTGYNLQIATNKQYILGYDVFPNSTDTRTLLPFLNTLKQSFLELPVYIVADAG